MESCGNYYFQIRKVAGVADDSLDSLLVNDRGIAFGPVQHGWRVINFWLSLFVIYDDVIIGVLV